MCNLYANTLAPTLMRQLFKVRAENDQLGNAQPLTAIFPKGTAPVVALDDDCNPVLRNTHWGFVLPQTSKKTGKQLRCAASSRDRFKQIAGICCH
mgnify:CR=1 FL=1